MFWLRLFVWYLRLCCDLVLGYMCLGCSFWRVVLASRFLFDCIVMLGLLGFYLRFRWFGWFDVVDFELVWDLLCGCGLMFEDSLMVAFSLRFVLLRFRINLWFEI